MNKQEYMLELEKSLKARKVQDIADILGEYEQHFIFKLSDGYSEEEIANRLEKPDAIAEQFAAGINIGSEFKNYQKVILGIGMGFAGIFSVMILVFLYGWAIVLGTFSLTVSVLGILLISGINIAGLIPPIPYLGGLILGISFVGLGVLSSVGTTYFYLYFNQWVKVYVRWHKNTMNGGVYPRLSKHPNISDRFNRRLRVTAVISLAAFGIMLIIGMFVMFAYTGFKPFWHELNWFQ